MLVIIIILIILPKKYIVVPLRMSAMYFFSRIINTNIDIIIITNIVEVITIKIVLIIIILSQILNTFHRRRCIDE